MVFGSAHLVQDGLVFSGRQSSPVPGCGAFVNSLCRFLTLATPLCANEVAGSPQNMARLTLVGSVISTYLEDHDGPWI